MSPKDHLIERLRELCETQGGVDVVADATESSSANIRQILAGTKLPSGSPRGVGPNLQKRLDATYPGWSALGRHPRIEWPFERITVDRWTRLSAKQQGAVEYVALKAIEEIEGGESAHSGASPQKLRRSGER